MLNGNKRHVVSSNHLSPPQSHKKCFEFKIVFSYFFVTGDKIMMNYYYYMWFFSRLSYD